MSASEILSKIVEREASKLEKKSSQKQAPLTADELESLETLARTAKTLREPHGQGRPVNTDEGNLEDDLALLQKK